MLSEAQLTKLKLDEDIARFSGHEAVMSDIILKSLGFTFYESELYLI